MTLSDEKYVLLTTHRKNGVAVPTPVWIAALDDGRLGFMTSSVSGKVKRLREPSKVALQACDSRGRIKEGSDVIEATAQLATPAELVALRAKIAAKYGIMVKVMTALNSVVATLKRKRIPQGDAAIVITLS